MFRDYCLIFVSLVLISSSALGLGADHKKGDLPPHHGWLAGTYEAVNLQSRVHGYWINSRDMFFYKDDHAGLEAMLEKLGSIQGLTVRVILHPGKGVAKSPWSKEALDSADWMVTIAGNDRVSQIRNEVTVDVWLGGSISLDKLRVPQAVEVQSGNEIEAYIENRTTEAKK